MKIRIAHLDDAAAVQAIYAPYVENTTISFELFPPDVATMGERMASTLATHPWIIAEEQGTIVGYAYGSMLRTRAAYNWSAELSVYLDNTRHGKGWGGKLYAALIDLLKAQGYCTVYGCLVAPNAPSERLHEKLGFTLVGTWNKCGFKLGEWLNVAWYEKHIAHPEGQPAPVQPFAALQGKVVSSILAQHNET